MIAMSTSSQIYILAEQNGEQIKVPYSEFEAQFVKYTQTTPSTPNSQPTDSTQGMVTADGWDPGFLDDGGSQSSFYVYSNNLWRKIPTYTNHWSDLEGDKVRFLPVHKKLTDEDALSEEEIENLRYNIKLPIATTEQAGLVKAGEASSTKSYVQVIANEDETSEENGKMFVQFATLTNPGTVLVEDIVSPVTPPETDENEAVGQNEEEVENEESGENEEIGETVADFPIVVYSKAAVDALFNKTTSNIPTADASTLGLIAIGDHLKMGDDGRLTVVKAVVQATPEFGVVKYADAGYVTNITADADYVYGGTEQEENETTLTIHQIKALIDSKIENSSSNDAKIEAAGVDKPGVISVDGKIFTVDQDGTARLDINLASKSTKGAVFVIDTLSNESAIQTSFSNHVPTALSVVNFVNNKINEIENNTVTVPIATNRTAGIVIAGPGLSISTDGTLQVNYPVTSSTTLGLVKTLNSKTLPTGSNNDAKLVPTVYTMQNYVDSKLTTSGSGGSIPAASSTSLGGVYVQKASTETGSNPTVYTKAAVDLLFTTKSYVDSQIQSVKNVQAIIPKATYNSAGAVKVRSISGEADNDTNGGYMVPTINYMEQRLSAIGGAGDSDTETAAFTIESKDVGDVCSSYSYYKNWLLIGSDTLDAARLSYAARIYKAAYPEYETINNLVLLNKDTNEAFPEGYNVLTFLAAVTYTTVYTLIQYYYNNTADFTGNPLTTQDIDFVILPASAKYSQQL